MYPQQQQTYYGDNIPTQYGTPAKKSKKRLIIIVVAVVFVALLGILAAATGKSQTPDQKFATSFANLYASGQSAKTYNMLLPETQSKETKAGWDSQEAIAAKVFGGKKPKYLRSVVVAPGVKNGPTQHFFIANGSDSKYTFVVLVTSESGKRSVKTFDSLLR